MKKILVIDASPRKNGNSKVTADLIAAGACDAQVEIFALRDKSVRPCLACDACKRREQAVCVQKDDFSDLLPRIEECDAFVFITPIYFGQMTGPAKTFVDRLYCYFHPAHEGSSLASKRGRKAAAIGFCGMGDVEAYRSYLANSIGSFSVAGADEFRVVMCNMVNEPGSCAKKDSFNQELHELIDWLH